MEIISVSKEIKTTNIVAVGSYFEIDNRPPNAAVSFSAGLLKFPVYNRYLRTDDGRWFEFLSGGIQQTISGSKAKQLEELFIKRKKYQELEKRAKEEGWRDFKLAKITKRYQDLSDTAELAIVAFFLDILFGSSAVFTHTENKTLTLMHLSLTLAPLFLYILLRGKIKIFNEELEDTIFPKYTDKNQS